MTRMSSDTSWYSRSSGPTRPTPLPARMADSERRGRSHPFRPATADALTGTARARAGPPGGRRTAPARRLVIDVVTTDDWRAPGLARWLESVAPSRARGVMTVALVPDARVRELNRRFRGR